LLIIDITKDTLLGRSRADGSRGQLKAAVLNRERPVPKPTVFQKWKFSLDFNIRNILYIRHTCAAVPSLEPRLELSGRKNMASQKLSAMTLAFTAEGALQAMDSESGSSYECRMFD
jgi:hypothetical protein